MTLPFDIPGQAEYDFLGGLASLFNFSRASSGTYWNGTALATAATNVARFDAAGGPLGGYGLLLEPQSTNIFPNSRQVAGFSLSNATGANTATGIDGVASSAIAFSLANTSAVVQTFSIAVSQNTKYAASFFVKGSPSIGPKYAVYDFSNSSFLVSATSYGASINSSTYTRIIIPFSTVSGTVSISIMITYGSGGAGELDVDAVTCETLPYASSVIFTSGSPITRATDSLYLPASAVPWINPALGYTVAASLDTLATGAQVGTGGLIEAYQDGNNYDLAVAASGNGLYFQKIIGGVTQQVFSSTLSAANHMIAYSANGAVVTGSLDGAVVTTPSNPGVITPTAFYLGNVQSGLYGYPIHLRRLRLWNYPMSSAQLGGLTI